MNRSISNKKRRPEFAEGHEKGQGLVEYALILVLIAIVVIAALMVLGPIIGNVFSDINSSLEGVGGGGGGGGTNWSAGNNSSTMNAQTCVAKTNPGQNPALTYYWGNGPQGVGCYW